MKAHDVFWRLEALSDRQLLERVGSVLGSSRRVMAELIAHLGEVEERRLHLVAACSSMFAYCLKLGMTEDEAYRRIEVARLARRYPNIFALLADGQLSISVVALLKHYLSDENQLELLAAVAGKSVAQTREVIAARFPRPDVIASVRKVPERRTTLQPSLAVSTEASTAGTKPCTAGATGSVESARPGVTEVVGAGGSTGFAPASESTCTTRPETPARATDARRGAPTPTSSRIEPLSAQRYKVQFTAGAELARKLELARDLMLHSHPGGELGTIVERGLDLLIESLMRRRFGKKGGLKRPSEGAGCTNPEQRGDAMGDPFAVPGTAKARKQTFDPPALATTTSGLAERVSTPLPITTPDIAERASTPLATTPDVSECASTPLRSENVRGDRRGGLARAITCSDIPRSARRTVLERDGLACSWVDEHGVRCGSRAWLEYDHRQPRAKGGGSEPGNLRLLCRNHNQLAAEQAYGRRHVEQAIAGRRREGGVACDMTDA